MGDVVFSSHFNNADDANADTNGDGVLSASDGFSPAGYDTNKDGWICPYISRHLLSLNPLQARCRRYSRGER